MEQKKGNMWDGVSVMYSRMTLMEINGTNMQLDVIPLDVNDIVLDCGCGPGRIAIQVAKRVKKVICLDSSEGMLNECKKNCEAAGVTNVEFVLADWQETEIGNTIPEVDVVIQARGGGGPSTMEMLKKAARKYAVNIMWSKGADNLPKSKDKLFVDCYSEESYEKYPDLIPFERKMAANGKRQGPPPGYRPMKEGIVPMGPNLAEYLQEKGIEHKVTRIDHGWDRVFATKDEAYEWLLPLSNHPEEVNMEQFKKNVDGFLTETEDGFLFDLPTSTDVTWFRTR